MLAIVIPYYKITFFEETLNSLANQTNMNFKVYIGDDASPEDPKSLLKSYHHCLDLKYERFDNNLGASSLVQHWDRCIKMTDGEEWLMILGDDDVLNHNLVESFYDQLPDFGGRTNVVRFASRIIFEKGDETSEVFKHPKWENPAKAFFRRFKGETRSSLSEYIFRKYSYLKHGFKAFPLAWHSDDCAWLDFPEDKDIYCINESEVHVRLSGKSISGKEDNLRLKSKAKIMFYRNILEQKLFMFEINQRKFLLEAYANTIRKTRKLKLKEWIFLTDKYLRHTNSTTLRKFLKRELLSKFNFKWIVL